MAANTLLSQSVYCHHNNPTTTEVMASMLEALPAEIRVQIVTLLNFEDCINLRYASKSWRDLLEDGRLCERITKVTDSPSLIRNHTNKMFSSTSPFPLRQVIQLGTSSVTQKPVCVLRRVDRPLLWQNPLRWSTLATAVLSHTKMAIFAIYLADMYGS